MFFKTASQEIYRFFGDKFYTNNRKLGVCQISQEKLLSHNYSFTQRFWCRSIDRRHCSCGAVLHYLSEIQHHIKHIANLQRIEESKHVWMDRFTIRNLVFHSSNEGDYFVGILDHSITPMGSRLLKRWVAFPLKNNYRIPFVSCRIFDAR